MESRLKIQPALNIQFCSIERAAARNFFRIISGRYEWTGPIFGGGCNIEFIQFWSTEDEAGDLGNRQLNAALGFAIRVITDDLPPIPLRVPDESVRIHSDAIGHAFVSGHADKVAAV